MRYTGGAVYNVQSSCLLARSLEILYNNSIYFFVCRCVHVCILLSYLLVRHSVVHDTLPNTIGKIQQTKLNALRLRGDLVRALDSAVSATYYVCILYTMSESRFDTASRYNCVSGMIRRSISYYSI